MSAVEAGVRTADSVGILVAQLHSVPILKLLGRLAELHTSSPHKRVACTTEAEIIANHCIDDISLVPRTIMKTKLVANPLAAAPWTL